jgi:hypothetical protein
MGRPEHQMWDSRRWREPPHKCERDSRSVVERSAVSSSSSQADSLAVDSGTI